MKRALDFLWPVVGLAAVVASFFLLAREFRGESVMGATLEAMRAIPPHRYMLAAMSTLVAYAALAWYDRIALMHLGVRHISWPFVSVCSFTTYALSHNIGASVFSGAMVRYRAYSTKGLTAAQVAILVALCSFTFFLGTILLGGAILVLQPQQLARLDGLLPTVLTQESAARGIGGVALLFAAVYAGGSLLHLRPLKIGPFRIDYPRPAVMGRQYVAAPMELIGAAGIIYFALPEAGNPGFVTVLAVFLASFSAGLVSHAPGGLGVFELVFITALPGIDKHQILAALIVFRLFYLLIPLVLGVIVVVIFERGRLVEAIRRSPVAPAPPAPRHEHGFRRFRPHATGNRVRPDRIVTRLIRLSLPLLLLAGLALGACGRRGPLEPPPGSAPPPPRAETRPVVDPASQSNATRPSLARDTSPQESLEREKVLTPVVPVTVPNTPFFLDPLL